jgi:ribose transport system substrate-binding protein
MILHREFRFLYRRRLPIAIFCVVVAGAVITSTVLAGSALPIRYRGWAVPAHNKYKIAYLCVEPSNTSSKVAVDGVKIAAAHLQVPLTMLLDNFSASEQLNQIDQAIASGKYNGFLTCTLDPSVTCKALTQDAEKAHIKVVVENSPVCNATAAGYTPGTIGFAGEQTQTTYAKYLTYVFKQLKPGSTLGVVAGPPTLNITTELEAAVKQVAAKFPQIKVVRVQTGNFTVADGLSEANALLGSYPNVSAIYSAYDDNTAGVIAALKAAGKSPGQVKLYELGSAKQEFDYMKQGWIQGILYFDSLNQTSQALEMLLASLEGRPFPKVDDVSADPGLPHHSAYVTPATVKDYTSIG